jgi:hypothetical protein
MANDNIVAWLVYLSMAHQLRQHTAKLTLALPLCLCVTWSGLNAFLTVSIFAYYYSPSRRNKAIVSAIVTDRH